VPFYLPTVGGSFSARHHSCLLPAILFCRYRWSACFSGFIPVPLVFYHSAFCTCLGGIPPPGPTILFCSGYTCIYHHSALPPFWAIHFCSLPPAFLGIHFWRFVHLRPPFLPDGPAGGVGGSARPLPRNKFLRDALPSSSGVYLRVVCVVHRYLCRSFRCYLPPPPFWVVGTAVHLPPACRSLPFCHRTGYLRYRSTLFDTCIRCNSATTWHLFWRLEFCHHSLDAVLLPGLLGSYLQAYRSTRCLPTIRVEAYHFHSAD